MANFFKRNRWSIMGGATSAVLTGMGAFLLGNISGYEAKVLMSSSISGINMLCNTIILASATILALLLTLLGISSGTKSKIKKDHYKQVLYIAKVDTILIVGALILFQFFNIPITESDNVPTTWFTTIYWSTLFASSLLSGMMVTVILLLYVTVTDIIAIVGLDKKDHYLLSSEETEEND